MRAFGSAAADLRSSVFSPGVTALHRERIGFGLVSKDFVYYLPFREKGREEKEREKKIDVRKKH